MHVNVQEAAVGRQASEEAVLATPVAEAQACQEDAPDTARAASAAAAAAQPRPAEPVSAPQAQAAPPADFQKIVGDKAQALEGQNSAVNVRAREAAKLNRRKIRELSKLVADTCASACCKHPQH
jgi:hypothetical protein